MVAHTPRRNGPQPPGAYWPAKNKDGPARVKSMLCSKWSMFKYGIWHCMVCAKYVCWWGVTVCKVCVFWSRGLHIHRVEGCLSSIGTSRHCLPALGVSIGPRRSNRSTILIISVWNLRVKFLYLQILPQFFHSWIQISFKVFVNIFGIGMERLFTNHIYLLISVKLCIAGSCSPKIWVDQWLPIVANFI